MNRLLRLGLCACPIVGALAAASTAVSQRGRAFSVSAAHIHRGESIRFTNDDVFDHHVFIDSPHYKFDSAEQAPGSALEVPFPIAGTFDVQCQIHPRMHLAVTVD